MSNLILPESIHTLVVAEKPSVGQSIASVIGASSKQKGYLSGNGYIVSWCVGHLVELAMPQDYDDRYAKWNADDLPIFPDPWKYSVSPATRDQFSVLKSLMNHPQVKRIVCATDAGREGELIFRLVYSECHCTKPVQRLWISSLEESAIRDGIQRVRDSHEYDHLYEAALCRQKADWLVGINASRFFSLIYGTTLSIGRVMTPTLALLTEREKVIESFSPEKFYTVDISCGFPVSSQRFSAEEEARKVLSAVSNQTGYIRKVTRRQKQEKPPKLYDLTTLQRDANRLFGYTAQQTLDYAQALYEKKFITYPRTDSQFLTEDARSYLPAMADTLITADPNLSGMTINIRIDPVINPAKVSDHHAIIPTRENLNVDHVALPVQERILLEMISNRLICALADPFVYDETEVTLECMGYTFTGKGRTITNPGWKLPYEVYLRNATGKKPDEEKTPSSIDTVFEGQRIFPITAKVHEGETTPPKHFTEDSLLAAMENAGAADMPEDAERKGLGTPATRAGILEKLVQSKLIVRQGAGKTRNLLPTEKGKALIQVVPNNIQSPEMTADWEQRLKAIEHGQDSAEAFLMDIQSMLLDLMQSAAPVDNFQQLFPSKRPSVGTCPVCGSAVTIREKGYFCENRTCHFAIWKDNRFFTGKGKEVTKELVTELLASREAKLTGLRSEKSGKTYDATVHLDVDPEGRARFTLSFPEGQRGRR